MWNGEWGMGNERQQPSRRLALPFLRPLPFPIPHSPFHVRKMSLLESEAGKRRLLSVEIPVIERYNEGRDPAYRIKLARQGGGLVLKYALKPGHNVYELETRLASSYPTVPPETRVL